MAAKRKPAGRPVVGAEPVKLYNVYLEPAAELQIRERYGGPEKSRSAGVRRMLELLTKSKRVSRG